LSATEGFSEATTELTGLFWEIMFGTTLLIYKTFTKLVRKQVKRKISPVGD